MVSDFAKSMGFVEGSVVPQRVKECRMPEWYPSLAPYSFPTAFVKLRQDEKDALLKSDDSSPLALGAIARLDNAMGSIVGNRFVGVDLAAPTDTERFALKRGAVYSALSAWRILASSAKVRASLSSGCSDSIVVRPFRRMDITREFRLFIKGGMLKGMSQYWLVRHFRRLEGRRDFYWQLAKDFVSSVSWCLPAKDIAMDIYFTSTMKILVIDLNPWGRPTDPLMLRDWDLDWGVEKGLCLVPPPTKISGDVNVSF